MGSKVGVRLMLVSLAAAGLVLLQACAPIPRVIDTPKDGAQIDLSVKQPMQVRWSNMNPGQGAWVLETPPAGAVTLVGQKAQPAEGGGVALDIFDFAGAKAGSEQLTFVYRRRDGAPPTAEDRVSVAVRVS